MYIVEVEINGESTTKTFNNTVKLLEFYSSMSIGIFKLEINTFEMKVINKYSDGKLEKHKIIATSNGLKVMPVLFVEEEDE